MSSSWNPNQERFSCTRQQTLANKYHYKTIEKHTLERTRGGGKSSDLKL